MKTHVQTLFSLGLAGMLCGALSLAAPPAGKPTPAATNQMHAPAKQPPAKKKRPGAGYPFRGRLTAVNPAKKTITVTTKNTRKVFPVSAKTKFSKNGKPAQLSDGVVGEEVAGYVRKLEGGELLAVTVRFGPKPKTDPTARKRLRPGAGYPFRGKLAALDPVKKTITVATKNTRRVFPVNEKTRFTRHGKPAKLSDGVVGEKVSGYVRKLADGKLLAVTVHFSPPPRAKPQKQRTPKPTPAPTSPQ